MRAGDIVDGIQLPDQAMFKTFFLNQFCGLCVRGHVAIKKSQRVYNYYIYVFEHIFESFMGSQSGGSAYAFEVRSSDPLKTITYDKYPGANSEKQFGNLIFTTKGRSF